MFVTLHSALLLLQPPEHICSLFQLKVANLQFLHAEMANFSANIQLPAMVLTLLAISSAVCATTINVRNQCSYTVSACDQAAGTSVSCYALQNGQSRLLNVGSVWDGGLIWGFPSSSGDSNQGILAKPQANLAEITIGLNGQDSYDLSNVDAYNLPLLINPTSIAGGGQRDGLHCGTPICSIANLNSFCQSPNYLTGGPGNGCKNANGPGTVATAGTTAFKNACQSSFSYSTDVQNTVYGCNIGSNYEVVFCP